MTIQVQFKDKKGNIWYSCTKNHNLKIGDKFDAKFSPIGKKIGEVEVISVKKLKFADVTD